jgi:hypothetical protein
VQRSGVLAGSREQLAAENELVAHRGRVILTAERWIVDEVERLVFLDQADRRGP